MGMAEGLCTPPADAYCAVLGTSMLTPTLTLILTRWRCMDNVGCIQHQKYICPHGRLNNRNMQAAMPSPAPCLPQHTMPTATPESNTAM